MSDELREDQYREVYETAFGEFDDEYEVDDDGQFRLTLSDRWRDRD